MSFLAPNFVHGQIKVHSWWYTEGQYRVLKVCQANQKRKKLKKLIYQELNKQGKVISARSTSIRDSLRARGGFFTNFSKNQHPNPKSYESFPLETSDLESLSSLSSEYCSTFYSIPLSFIEAQTIPT